MTTDHDDTGPLETSEGESFYSPMSAIPAGEPATVTLGEICRRLGITMTAAFVEQKLRIPQRAVEKAAKLYSEQDFHRICQALIGHISHAMLEHAGL